VGVDALVLTLATSSWVAEAGNPQSSTVAMHPFLPQIGHAHAQDADRLSRQAEVMDAPERHLLASIGLRAGWACVDGRLRERDGHPDRCRPFPALTSCDDVTWPPFARTARTRCSAPAPVDDGPTPGSRTCTNESCRTRSAARARSHSSPSWSPTCVTRCLPAVLRPGRSLTNSTTTSCAPRTTHRPYA
jgi:hypothetical protein